MAQRLHAHLPARSAPGLRGLTEYLSEALVRSIHLISRPLWRFFHHAVLPAHVIPAMNAAFETSVARRLHRFSGAFADVRAGDQCAVEERLQAVVGAHRRAPHFGQKSRSENALDRATCIVGA